MREADLERKFVDTVKRHGGKAYKWVSSANAGVPDRIVFLPGGKIFFVELKTKTGRLSSVQTLQIRRLRQFGQDVRVLYGEQDIQEFFDEVLKK